MKNPLWGILICFVLPFFSSCGKEEEQKNQMASIDIPIGVAGPLTGGVAHLGQDCEEGVVLAVHDLNEKRIVVKGRPVHFRVVSLNDMDDPRQATSVAQRFVDSHVVAVVGHLNSGATIPASFIYARNELPQLSVSSNVRYTQQGFRTAFRIMANDFQQGRAIAQFATQDLRFKRFVVIDDQSSYGQGLADIFIKTVKASKGLIVSREYVSRDTNDFGALLMKIKQEKPDAVFFGGMDVQATPLAKQMHQLGLSAALLSGDMSCTSQFEKQVKTGTISFFCSTNSNDMDHMAQGVAFKKHFKAFFRHSPVLYSPYTYDATMLIGTAIKKIQSADPRLIIHFLHHMKKPYAGVTGAMSFDSSGDLVHAAVSIYALCFQGLCLHKISSS